MTFSMEVEPSVATEPVTAASVLTELLGSLDALGVLVLPAVPELPSMKMVFFSVYICHPSQANINPLRQ